MTRRIRTRTPPCSLHCDESIDACIECRFDGQCDDEQFCNGLETCVSNSCVAGSDPCPGQLCDEAADTCVDCFSAIDCDDTIFCNGLDGECIVSRSRPKLFIPDDT